MCIICFICKDSTYCTYFKFIILISISYAVLIDNKLSIAFTYRYTIFISYNIIFSTIVANNTAILPNNEFITNTESRSITLRCTIDLNPMFALT